MNIPRYWAKEMHAVRDLQGKVRSFACWRWSDTSIEEAREAAKARVMEIARKFLAHEKLDRYSYGERPLREEIIEVIRNRGNETVAVVTRNAYGALVLNAARVMFVDIDFPRESGLKSFLRTVRKRFGTTALSPEADRLREIEQWTRTNPTWSMRVYRTFGGFRCLVTDRVFHPARESTLEVLRSLHSDPSTSGCARGRNAFGRVSHPSPVGAASRSPHRDTPGRLRKQSGNTASGKAGIGWPPRGTRPAIS